MIYGKFLRFSALLCTWEQWSLVDYLRWDVKYVGDPSTQIIQDVVRDKVILNECEMFTKESP